MDFNIFESSFDVVVVYDDSGLIEYANSSFYLFSGLSVARVIGKMTLGKVFIEIDEQPLKLNSFIGVKEARPMKVISFKTKSVEKGLGQYSIVPFEGKYILFFKDVTIEEELHKKYRREMGLKDKKIEEMDSLIELLHNTRLVKEPSKILEEFIKHILNNFGLGVGLLKSNEKEIVKIINSNYLGQSSVFDSLNKKIQGLPATTKYTYIDSDKVKELLSTSHIHSMVVLPIQVQSKDLYEIFIPIHNPEKAQQFDHQKVITLAEQMKLLIQNMTLERLSIFDDLTKLHNSRFFREKLTDYTNRYEKLNLVLLDIDFFKKINDSYGHPGGDAVLVHVGQILRLHQNNEVLVSRVGGEEFAILAPDQTLDQTLDMAAKISEQIKSSIVYYETKQIKCTISIGICSWNPEVQTVRDFYKKTDEALYESKANGRDRITVLQSA
ncbi:MAG: sensor domain-containing diguanylate cyclase [Bdellovibrionaceae bacterium]|nr:sensor domain-containing diguanylate cyclase [Pseudobdellovibrionaceae bacterium]